MIYLPSDDSYLLVESLKKIIPKIKNKSIKILDMGSGSGIQAQTCIDAGFNNILVSDIDKEVVNNLKDKGFNSVQSDLFSNIPIKDKFGLIIFNPPYLPKDKQEPKESRKATTGGSRGDEIILKFLKQAKFHLNENGKILLLLSSLTPKERIILLIKKLNLKYMQIASKKLFFEELYVWQIDNQ